MFTVAHHIETIELQVVAYMGICYSLMADAVVASTQN